MLTHFWQQIEPMVVSSLTVLLPALTATGIACLRARLQVDAIESAVDKHPDEERATAEAKTAVTAMHPFMRPSPKRADKLIGKAIAAKAKS